MLLREKFETCQFSNTEQEVVEFILRQSLNLENLTIGEISKQCFTVPSTLVRISHKMGYTGWKELKNAYIQEEKYLQEHFFDIDANQPFSANDSIMNIAYKLAILKKETIDDMLSLIHHDDLQNAVKIINKAQVIHIFSIGHNRMLAQKFQYDMERIHKQVIIHSIENDFIYQAYLLDETCCALIISYSGESEIINNLLKIINRKIPTIAITCIGESQTSQLVQCNLRITTREKLYSKIASYSTDESIVYLLELLYSCVFQLNYQKNIDEKKRISKLTESRNTIDNSIIKE